MQDAAAVRHDEKGGIVAHWRQFWNHGDPGPAIVKREFPPGFDLYYLAAAGGGRDAFPEGGSGITRNEDPGPRRKALQDPRVEMI
jgi:hypothetical protein